MDSLNDIQEDVRLKINKAISNFKKCPKDRRTVSYLETRLESLEQQWQLFSKTHVTIISEIKKSELYSSNYHKNCVYDDVEELYIQFKSELKESISKCNVIQSSEPNRNPGSNNGMESINFRLPEVKIPVFSGKYIEWKTFRDLFLGLIHNNSRLDDAQKLYYLKGYLTGEAEYLLRNVEVTADNYNVSWQKLESMYNNKRFLANGVLKSLLNQKNIANESAADIKRLVSTTSDCLGSLKNLGIDVTSWDIIVIHIVSAKLDRETRRAWELMVASDPTDDLPTFDQFREFLVSRYRGLESIDTKTDTRNTKSTHALHVVGKEKGEVSCSYCSAAHNITNCNSFINQGVDVRRNFVHEKRLCFTCLSSKHSARFCKNTGKCKVCKKRHHTLLHSSDGSQSSEKATLNTTADLSKNRLPEENKMATPRAEGADTAIVSCLSTGTCKDTVLLPTALINAEARGGTYRVIRALIDQGSQGSFITEAMAQYLGLKKTPTNHLVAGVGGHKTVNCKATVNIKVQSRVDPTFTVQVKAFVLRSITSLLPVVKATRIEWVDLKNTELADPEYDRPNKIDVLLGAEVYCKIIQDGIKTAGSGPLVAQDTVLGWILSGVVGTDNSEHVNSYPCITVLHSNIQADDLLKKFWEIEAEPSGTKKMLTEDEVKCETLFTTSTIRNSEGRYIVRLPVRDVDLFDEIGDSKLIAEKRLRGLELRLGKNPTLRDNYIKVMQEYLDLNHMKKVIEGKSTNNRAVYLPHHAVVREDKDTTKVRVVFDASCKGSKGMSLNDNLLVGPTLQADLRHIVMRWRTHRICLVADIVKMYRQVLVDEKDTIYQRILWRDSPTREIEQFELVTVTFGTASAPYLAVRALHQVAYDECQGCPKIRDIIVNDFYMDDLMTGAENIEEAYEIYTNINEKLKKGGFVLQKWKTNSRELLDQIKVGKGTTEEELQIKLDDVTKILGLTWNSSEDIFQYSINLPTTATPATKRKIISDISRLFDPLGWLAPCIVKAKILIQKLWLAGIGWDQEVPEQLLKEWLTYREKMSQLVTIRIPRWMHVTSTNVTTELHGFADASKLAYGAVVYLRVVDISGNVFVSIVASKTKVAPVKQVSIPRLELCGALLLAKLLIEVGEVMAIPRSDWHAWTDSEVVLAWLNSHPSRWKTFVGNRVSEILTSLDTHHWAHVSTKQNPADCASRGICPSELEKTSLWWDGPSFLRDQVITYKRPKHLVTQLEEVKVHTSTVDSSFWSQFSSLLDLIRTVAYARRFLLNLKKHDMSSNEQAVPQPPSRQELEEALIICVKKCQEEGFAAELDLLKSNKPQKIGNSLKSLNLFLDSKGTMRVGGRLERSQLSYDRTHPILMPKDSFLTELLISDAHKNTLHGGPQLMTTYLRSKYWIVGVKLLVKKYVRACVKCIRYSAQIKPQLMGQLPAARVTPTKPFLSSGVDYAGPINIRVSKGRGNTSYKGYICLFVCMTTRAVHLEAVSELSSKGFLAAFKRFVARRGRCSELHSDNGTNFVGAARELLYLFNKEKSYCNPEIAEALADNGTEWRFIPPHAPNFGGLWEAGIKSTKFHLKRVIGNSTLTFEEMATVLAQVEACLNSRPLSYHEDQDKLTILTPGHFLVGEALVLPPDYNYEASNINSLQRWQLHQRMVQDFWRRWSQDYLHQFLQRRKWSHVNPEPSVGDVVLVKEDDLPPGKWLLGRVEQKHPGADGITRVVTLRVKSSSIKRPASKLSVLPIT